MQPTMRELLADYPKAAHVLVDIPIGLPWKECPVRPCDRLARQHLERRASSVFPVPCRKASRAADVYEARRENLEELDRSLSAQAWGICRKIAEVDELLLSEPVARRVIHEIHPEVCFWGLNERRAMQHPKRTAAGVLERVDVLARYEPRTAALLAAALAEQRRRNLQADDLLDALVGFVVARASAGDIERLHGNPVCDERGLPMEMVYLTSDQRPSAF
jgi:predicted RNase H-like nuclease